MPTINNPYASPIAGPLSNLAKAFMTGPDEATRTYRAEEALKLQRQRQGLADVADVAGAFGTPRYDRNRLVSSAILGGYKPEDLAVIERFQTANRYGAKDPRTTNAFVGAGGAYGSTGQGFDETQTGLDRRNTADNTEKRYEFENKPIPVGTDKGPIFARTSESYGKPAVEDLSKVKGNAARVAMNQPGGIDAASPTTKVFIGATKEHSQTPHMWVDPDGTRHMTIDNATDALTGQPLKPGGSIVSVQGDPNSVGLRPGVQSDLQKSNAAIDRMNSVAEYARGLIKPQNAGAAGIIKGAAQDMAQVASSLAQGLGFKGAEDVVANIKERVAKGGLDGQEASTLFTFDPKLPQLSSAYHALTLTAADAIAGGVGKASDKDIKAVRGILGDPESLFANAEYLYAKLDALSEIANRMHGANTANLRGGQGSAATPAAPGANPPTPPAPGAPLETSDPLGIR